MSRFRIPSHLKKYIVPQDYSKYSPEDQAIWRFIMRGICKNLSLHGAKGGLEALEQTGIRKDKIPKIANIDKKLRPFNWRAVCISGFIPPRAFMEFQLYNILPIASEIRPLQHIFYTPAPDILHESAGHVPFLSQPVFARFLNKYAQLVLKAIFSKRDMDRYRTIRDLSDLKSHPSSSKAQIQKKERELKNIMKNTQQVSEAGRLARLIWWTSEYGLIGSLQNPKIYGAGLISSIAESLQIKKAQKLRLSKDCLNFPFDITRFQPQLFVAESFEQLLSLLEEISAELAFNRGGLYGLTQALEAKSLNTVVLDTGLQISGWLESILQNKKGQPIFVKFKGPVSLSHSGQTLKGHGLKEDSRGEDQRSNRESDRGKEQVGRHSNGYSSPLRPLKLSFLKLPSSHRRARRGTEGFQLSADSVFKITPKIKAKLKPGERVEILFDGGIRLKGTLKSQLWQKRQLLLLTFYDCLIVDGEGELLYHPDYGEFDLAWGREVVSVFSGPADEGGRTLLEDDFRPPKKVIVRKPPSKSQQRKFALYREINQLKSLSQKSLNRLIKAILKEKHQGLLFWELLNLSQNSTVFRKQILKHTAALKDPVLELERSQSF